MDKPIINIADVTLNPRPPAMSPKREAAEKYDAKMGFIGTRIGARKLGYNLTAVPPGKCAFPLHNHQVNEEMFFILQGSGELRMGDAVHAIRTGDVIACPPGGKDVAHQIVNTGTEELRYLAVSTKESPELVDYPDSGKFGILAERPGSNDRFAFIGRADQSLDYWEGN
ncbi:cupin domain-containing protein [Massilia sp. TW-1]|uniref:Cupin domain-containing protein n=1 Tax=Telluria antibiotica TaxID=2717319 RepID=A0ABX0PJF6_9BURK|nr:cupin domain-containing protein [Telluria antibiotica]NIA57436.1 cupin domain-containing protein [Telluria antibiotica]